MRITVSGPRSGVPPAFVWGCLESLDWPVTHVNEGGAGGVDVEAATWADRKRLGRSTVKADWRKGRKAGPMRNALMLDDSEALVAFRVGWQSPGTASCIRQAWVMGMPIKIFYYHGAKE